MFYMTVKSSKCKTKQLHSETHPYERFTQSWLFSVCTKQKDLLCILQKMMRVQSLTCMGHKTKINTVVTFKVPAIFVHRFGCKNKILFQIKKSITLKNWCSETVLSATQNVIHFIMHSILPYTVAFSKRISLNKHKMHGYFQIKIQSHTYIF